MDQIQTGRFIAELRKENKMTQTELGEKVGVTNKTVSRWENGNYMPDISLLPALSSELGVSINELISGRRFDREEFKQSADDNLMVSFTRIKNFKRQKKLMDFFTGGGTGLVIGCLFSPDSVQRTAVIVIGIIMIAAGQLLQSRFNHYFLGKMETK